MTALPGYNDSHNFELYQDPDEYLLQLLDDWVPRVHCSNCMNCIVFQDQSSGQIKVSCKEGYGSPKLLTQIIAEGHAGRGWRNASLCPNYVNAGDEWGN